MKPCHYDVNFVTHHVWLITAVIKYHFEESRGAPRALSHDAHIRKRGARVSELKAGEERERERERRRLATSKASFRALRPPFRATRRGVKIQCVQLATRGGPTGSLNMRDLVGQHLLLP